MRIQPRAHGNFAAVRHRSNHTHTASPRRRPATFPHRVAATRLPAPPRGYRHRTFPHASFPIARRRCRTHPHALRGTRPARARARQVRHVPVAFHYLSGIRSTGLRSCPPHAREGTGIRCRRSRTTVGEFLRQRTVSHRRASAHDRPYRIAARRGTDRPAARAAAAGLPRKRYFFSGSVAPGCLNGNVLNIDFAWFCICSCICTNMFFDCSM